MMDVKTILQQLSDSKHADILISYDDDRYFAVIVTKNQQDPLCVSGPYIWDDEQSLNGHFEAPDQIYPKLHFIHARDFVDYLEGR